MVKYKVLKYRLFLKPLNFGTAVAFSWVSAAAE